MRRGSNGQHPKVRFDEIFFHYNFLLIIESSDIMKSLQIFQKISQLV